MPQDNTRTKNNSKKQTTENEEAIRKIIKHYKDEPYIQSLRWMFKDAKKKFEISMSEKTFYRRIEQENYALVDNRLKKMHIQNIYKHSHLISDYLFNKHFAFRLRKPPYAPLVVKILNQKLGKENFYCTNINEIILCFYDSWSIKEILNCNQSCITETNTTEQPNTDAKEVIAEHVNDTQSNDVTEQSDSISEIKTPEYWLKKINDILEQTEYDTSIY